MGPEVVGGSAVLGDLIWFWSIFISGPVDLCQFLPFIAIQSINVLYFI